MRRSVFSSSRFVTTSFTSSRSVFATSSARFCTTQSAAQQAPAAAAATSSSTARAAETPVVVDTPQQGGGLLHFLKTAAFVGLAAGAAYGAYTYGYYDEEGKLRRNTFPALSAEELPTALNPNDFVPFKLKEKIVLNHDTRIFRFALGANQRLGLPVASCIVTRTPGPDGKPVVRPYTPITTEDTVGYFDLLVKVYPEGNMSKHIDSLKLGESLEVKGPIPKIPYTANMKKEIGMLAGGTGITPMYQVLLKILNNKDDHTKVSLIFCNKTVEDILLRRELDDLAAKHKNFHVYYMVDRAPENASTWRGGVGFITKETIKQHMPAPSDDNMVFVCGPPGFYNTVSGGKTPDYKQGPLTGHLKDLGYNESQVFKF